MRHWLTRRRLVLVALVTALSVGAAGLAGELALRNEFRKEFERVNRADIDLWRMVAYSRPILRAPHETISFGLYGLNGEELARADVRLNNLGLISDNDYHKEKMPGEFRIVVLGGEQTASSVADRSWPDFLETELLKRCPGCQIKAMNFGWPDAGPEHYIEYWNAEAAEYEPDLTIVNLVETDFYRTISGAELTYQGMSLAEWRGVERAYGHLVTYEVDRAKATHAVAIVRGERGPLSLLNPMVIAPRPYGFFLDRKFFENPALVRKLQEMLVEQQIAGTKFSQGSLLLEYLRGSRRRTVPVVAQIRNFDTPKQASIDRDALVQYGLRTFGWIARNIPNVVLLHSFSYVEIGQRFELTERMIAADPEIAVNDMRDWIPPGTSEAELQSWYMIPHMGEKWSLKGHARYAELVADLLRKKGLVPAAVQPDGHAR